MFWTAAPLYQEALAKSGYNYKLSYDPPAENPAKKKRCRKRTITWFNPPFASNVRTNIGAKFLKLIDKHFPPTNPLSKLINRNNVKVSYMCTPNLARTISAHNSKVISQTLPKPNVKNAAAQKMLSAPLAESVWKKILCTKLQFLPVMGPQKNMLDSLAPSSKNV